ncbi:4-hydroxy-tetrahydrodipicolinate synthase [Granulosicoccus sp. 3-233]|uniref:4-hydroxy-tetrahydrodipicolinate synthase n=1 Tax=Granulosicoccus sp. 3-233 TaxID=3417969 RepID=UPI003D33A527
MFEGSLVAMITPMTLDGMLDEPALRRLVNWHIEQGSNGLVPAGTTGESPVLSAEEHRDVIRIVIDETRGRVPVIAGCGSNNTREALAFHDYAHQQGADGALHVTGYYNRPSQQGIYRHFEALSESNELPIIVYNIPPRSTVDISADTMARLATLPSVVGVKDATRDLARPAIEQMKIDAPFSYLSGEDATAVAYNAAGGNGCISVTANVAPALCARLQQACRDNDYQTARDIQRRLMPLHEALFREPSPAGIKYACATRGLCTETLRLPLISLEDDSKELIDAALQSLEQDG